MEIALNSYSLRNELKAWGKNTFASMIKLCKDLGIPNVELLDGHFDVKQLSPIVKQFADAGIKVFALAPHTTLLAEPKKIAIEIKEGIEWLELAQQNNIEYIRIQIGNGALTPLMQPMEDFDEEEWVDYHAQVTEAIELTKAVANPLIEKAEVTGVKLGIETHHSYSSNYLYMHEFNKIFPSKAIGWIFDIGNYENDKMRWRALEEIKSRMCYLHAKSYLYNADGFETMLDYPKACRILHAAGFTGKWSIEFEGKMNGILGVSRTNELIKYCFAEIKGQKYQMRTIFPSGEELIKKYQK